MTPITAPDKPDASGGNGSGGGEPGRLRIGILCHPTYGGSGVVASELALTLASVGLYGVVAHGVTERTHEIGVRMALGADTRHVLGLVVGQGLGTVLAGLVIGVGAALALSRTMQGLLFGVTATDPATFAAVVAMLFSVGLVACYVPAWRATRVDPTTALRAE